MQCFSGFGYYISGYVRKLAHKKNETINLMLHLKEVGIVLTRTKQGLKTEELCDIGQVFLSLSLKMI